jgi:hypothetical protein
MLDIKTFFQSRGQVLALVVTILSFMPALEALLGFFGLHLPSFLLALDLAQVTAGLDKVVSIAGLFGIMIFRNDREKQIAAFLSKRK